MNIDTFFICMISGLQHEVYEISAFMGYHAVFHGNSLTTFQDKLSISSLQVKNPRRKSLHGFLDP
jgi:hypothetical protein